MMYVYCDAGSGCLRPITQLHSEDFFQFISRLGAQFQMPPRVILLHPVLCVCVCVCFGGVLINRGIPPRETSPGVAEGCCMCLCAHMCVFMFVCVVGESACSDVCITYTKQSFMRKGERQRDKDFATPILNWIGVGPRSTFDQVWICDTSGLDLSHSRISSVPHQDATSQP